MVRVYLGFHSPQRTDGPRDTVGAIAIDAAGSLASATSTSGTPYKQSGRVGDSAIFGAGGYAQANVAAVGTTGHGEQIYRTLLAKHASDCVALGMGARSAARAAAQLFDERFPTSMSGVIVIDHQGRFSAAQTAPKLAHGWMTEGSQPRTAMRSDA